MNETWLFVEWGPNRTWTRALVPVGLSTPRDLVAYLQRGGAVRSEWMEIPPRAHFVPRLAGRMTVIAALETQHGR